MNRLTALLIFTLTASAGATPWQEIFKPYEIKTSKVCDATRWHFQNTTGKPKIIDIRSYALKTNLEFAKTTVGYEIISQKGYPEGVRRDSSFVYFGKDSSTFAEIYANGNFQPYFDSRSVFMFLDAIDKYNTEMCIIEVFYYGRDNPLNPNK